jgi:transcription elongation factor Elf1
MLRSQPSKKSEFQILSRKSKVLQFKLTKKNKKQSTTNPTNQSQNQTSFRSQQKETSETFNCKVCNKQFKSKYSLGYHESEHESGKHTCHVCFKSFAIAAR